MFQFFRKKTIFTSKEVKRIEAAIKTAEINTSGEIRIFIENHCKNKAAMNRAIEIFNEHKMYATKERNGILIYLAIKDKLIAIYGDIEIHRKLGDEYWNNQVNLIIQQFKQQKVLDGITNLIIECGKALSTYFPYNSTTDKNELSDEIIFGK
ncbi:MAG: TPM domain-containing protein [Sediminibacterium sp.]|nr:TPM domain-containing protein [Sediminibacterium sp.]